MNSLPYPTNQSNTQKKAASQDAEKLPSAAETLFNAPVAFLTTPTQDTAITLYDMGLNVLPVPFAKKGGWPWKQFQYIRIHPKQILIAFRDRCNLAVMTGRTSGNLFVIDCETFETFQQQGEQLRRANIPIWSVRSSGTRGGGHYYLRCADGEVANIPPGEMKDVEVRGNRCYVLAPPSVHPDTGTVYQWDKRDGNQPPTVHIEDITWLPLKLATKAKKAAASPPAPFPQLSRTTQHFIINGAPEGERNNRLFAAACDMVGNNYDFHTTRHILTPVALTCGLPAKEIQNTLKSAFNKDREPARKNQSEVKSAPWQNALVWVETQAWTGRTGQTDRAVFLACVERARLASNEHGTFRASVREVAELARVNKETASKALKRLQEAKIIYYKGHDTTSGATLWSLGKETTNSPYNPYTNLTWSSNSVRVLRSDASEWRALGKTSSVVYEVLFGCEEPVMPKQLAERCILSSDQVQYALGKLSKYGLARREEKGWVAVRVNEQWLDENVAAVAGTLGKGEVRKARHIEERARRAGSEVLKARYFEERKAEEGTPVISEAPEKLEKSFHGVQYCQNCGQSIFVFDGMLPPNVCHFCAENYGWKQATIWLPNPPEEPTREKRQEREQDG